MASTSGTGELVLPQDINQAGWWDGSARLGDPYGAVVIAAHVDSVEQGLGNFSELLSTQAGATISVVSRDHRQDFKVVSARLVEKASLSGESPLYSASGERRLVLITCGGPYDPDSGYRDNMVVIAAADGGLAPKP
ncbi:MAG: class F sortase [Nocardioidaceae bacterium]